MLHRGPGEWAAVIRGIWENGAFQVKLAAFAQRCYLTSPDEPGEFQVLRAVFDLSLIHI